MSYKDTSLHFHYLIPVISETWQEALQNFDNIILKENPVSLALDS